MSMPVWPQAQEAKLRELNAQNLSYGQIAKELQTTRNAVIGKLNRLGLKCNHPRGGRPPKPKTHFTQKKRLRITLVEAPDRPPTEPVVIHPSPFDNKIPPEQRKTLLELTEHTCRWPVGEPDKPEFFFCGAYTDHTYCRHHGSRAWR